MRHFHLVITNQHNECLYLCNLKMFEVQAMMFDLLMSNDNKTITIKTSNKKLNNKEELKNL